MKWTLEKKEKLAQLAPSGLGRAGIGKILGCTALAVKNEAHRLRIQILRSPHRRAAVSTDDKLRIRWDKLIGPMKQKLRASIGGI